jgi:hypothetical protein
MGHYCAQCGSKQHDGIVPKGCIDCPEGHACVECFCASCWDNMFGPTYVQVEEDVYSKDSDGNFVTMGEKLYREKKTRVFCPDCKCEWFHDKFDYY